MKRTCRECGSDLWPGIDNFFHPLCLFCRIGDGLSFTKAVLVEDDGPSEEQPPIKTKTKQNGSKKP